MDHPRLTFFREFFRGFSHSPSGRVAELIKTALGAQIRSRALPRFRKPWMSEDYRISIFDAVAFANAYFRSGIKGA